MILNRQREVRLALQPLNTFFLQVKRELRIQKAEITICLVSDAEIARMNQDFRKKKGPTDVLSFRVQKRSRPRVALRKRAAKTSNRDSTFLGDIAISPAAARRNAARYGHNLTHEMRVLILHGVLHLLGYDHEADQGQMERMEARLRAKLRLT